MSDHYVLDSVLGDLEEGISTNLLLGALSHIQ